MNEALESVIYWWSGGDALMPVMLIAAGVLYALIGERAITLYRAGNSIRHRQDEISSLMGQHQTQQGRNWAASYLAIAEEAQLSRGLLMIRVLTVSLPLFGLLGTVTGMIDTFGALAASGTAGQSAQQASSGIGLALTATQYGMALAIPAVLAEWLLRRRVDEIVHHRQLVTAQASSDAIETVSSQQQKSQPC